MFVKIANVVCYLVMVVVNFMAVSLPLNNRSTKDISDAYPNLFAPAGYAFAIWSFIYLLLLLYVIYQFTPLGKKQDELLKKINPPFIISSIANTGWIFSWHYNIIWLSLIIMILLLLSLVKISDEINKFELKGLDRFFISVPFRMYFGWITVATIANITVFLVSIKWNGFGIPDFIWTVIILLFGMVIGIWRMNNDKSVVYGFVLIWAYIAILVKHLAKEGHAGKYPLIILTLVLCLILLTFFTGKLLLNMRKGAKS